MRQFLQNWNDDRQTCSKAINYRIFKDTFGFEDYFNILDDHHSNFVGTGA
jgi:hypothetical protein